MNREQLIENAARASHRWGLEFGGEHADWDALRESTRREYREEAAAVVEVLLPQVTTIEELLTYPDLALMISVDGYVLRWHSGVNQEVIRRHAAQYLANGPLTVVYTP